LGNSLAYDWLYSRLTSEERQRVRVSLGQWAQAMYEASTAPSYNDGWDNWWRKSYVQNHFWTNNSALGMAGLALLGEDERADVWVAHAKAQLIHVRDLLNAINDGSWHEGIHYQSYGLTMMLPFLVNLRALDGTDLIPHTYLRNYPAWRLYNYLPGTTQFILAYANFDWSWGNAYSPQNLLRFAAAEYGDGSAEWMAQQLDSAGGRGANVYNTPWHVLEFLYYDATVAAQPPSDVTQAHLFPDLEAVIWRTGWGEEDLVFGFKSGAYGGRFGFNSFTQGAYPWPVPCPETGCQLNTDHDHDDTNGFYIYQGGQWLAPESEGYRRTATSLHNTLLIDGQGQYRPAWERFGHHPEDYLASDGFLQQTADTTNFNYVVGDATRRYKQIDGIEAVTRHVVFVRPGYFLLLDHVAAATPHTYEWISHFGGAVTVDG
ncbi:MAG: DUF4962 domain-containing protein, partial [Caldilineaceae bacterium]|nr:DUF4962 domain-containing protein [Caldilineaceae bacterium]